MMQSDVQPRPPQATSGSNNPSNDDEEDEGAIERWPLLEVNPFDAS
jgi:hypothetical protein